MIAYRHMVIILLLLVHKSASKSVKRYRSDYEYNAKTDAFYKLHTEYATYEDAKTFCEAEGAKLMVATPANIVQAHGMLKQFPDILDWAWVGDDGLSHDSGESLWNPLNVEEFDGLINENTLLQCEAVNRMGGVEKKRCSIMCPFICMAKDAHYDATCKVYAKGYQYMESVGSCYMISSVAYSWNQAYDECRAHGAYLVVLNSELEHAVVHNLTHYAPKISSRAQSPWYWFAGVRAKKPENGAPVDYRTIFGQTLTEAGYDKWSDGEPNDLYGEELCGSIFTNDGKYNDLNCSHLFAFICEKEINVSSS